MIRDAKASLSKDQASLFKADRCNRKIIRSKERFWGPSPNLPWLDIFLIQLKTSQGRWASLNPIIFRISWVDTHETSKIMDFADFREFRRKTLNSIKSMIFIKIHDFSPKLGFLNICSESPYFMGKFSC